MIAPGGWMQIGLLLLAGFGCAAAGGELFVRALRTWCGRTGRTAALLGATVAAFATSSPELAVALRSASVGKPEIALGDCIGSNVINIGLILGVALCFGPLHCSRESRRRDLPAVIGASLLLAGLAWDGVVSRLDGVVLLAGFALWMGVAWKPDGAAPPAAASRPALAREVAVLTTGIALLVLASHWIVLGALGAARALGWPPFLTGSSIVALGTSTPEIVTMLYARLRGLDGMGLGTLLGSNAFNFLFIVAGAAVLHPILVTGRLPWAGLALGLAAAAVIIPGDDGVLGRGRGLALLGISGLHQLQPWWLAE